MRRVLCVALLLGLAGGAGVAAEEMGPIQVDVRRVRISLGFAGQQVFLFGQAPPGTERVVVVLEAPPCGPVRLMEKGRVGPFWLGVRQFRVEEVPGLYQTYLSCPEGNVLRPCAEREPLERVNRALQAEGRVVGPEAIALEARVEVLSEETAPVENRKVLAGLWALQERRGLYGVHPNRVRLNREGRYSCTCRLPAAAPEGKYSATVYFLSGSRLLGAAEKDLFVRRSGLVAWLSRLARHHAALYGGITVLIALGAGWLAGAIFRRETRH